MPEPQPGFWSSSFGSAEAVAATREFSELRASAAGLFWLEHDPATALLRLVHYCPTGSGSSSDSDQAALHYLSGPGQSVRSRVNEYGGGSFCATADAVYWVNERDQQIYRQAIAGPSLERPTATDRTTVQLTRAPDCRFGDLFHDAAFQRLLCVRETHGENVDQNVGQNVGQSVTQDLVAIDTATGALTLFASGADFYASPQVDIEGRQAAWIEWSLGAMPWDQTRLARAALDPSHGLPHAAPDQDPAVYLQPATGVDQSILQPRFDTAGRLWCLSDHRGWWQLYRLEQDGAWTCFDREEADQALPPSQLGQQQYVWLGTHGLVLTKLKRGWMQLKIKQDANTVARRLLPEFSLFRHLQCYQGRLYCIASAPDRSTSIVGIDLPSGRHRTLAGGTRPLVGDNLAWPEVFSFPVDGQSPGQARAHGFFYRPSNRHITTKPSQADSLAPLIVMTHGGPTSATYAVFNPMVQFWTQRGFAVADLNYRGSSGFGRAYRQALHHRWGISDVKDVLAALDELALRQWCDTQRAFIRGSSAGGFTTLSVLASSDRFLAGCSVYGVSDPWALRQVTHRFESRYLDWLIADPDKPEHFRARSPLHRAREIRTPLIFFQGGRDTVVVPAQTESIVAALRAEGLDVAYHYYPDEGHGFRQARVRQHALEHELAFFQARLEPGKSTPDG